MNKIDFIQNEMPLLMSGLAPDTKGNWGVLTAQGMVEHMSDSVREATGKVELKILTPPEKLKSYKGFAMSDMPFSENTKNSKMPVEQAPLRHKSISEAIAEYREEVASFLTYFKEKELSTLPNSFFGDLNFVEWTHLLHKHAKHHCKQFGLK